MRNERRLSNCNVIFLFGIHLRAVPLTAFLLNEREFTFFMFSVAIFFFFFLCFDDLQIRHVVSQQ